MNIRNLALAAAVGSLLGMSMTTASAADDKADKDKCYGVAQAGKNDCASNGHSCAGQAKMGPRPGRLEVRSQGRVREDGRKDGTSREDVSGGFERQAEIEQPDPG
jgi:uncharacterized membrane protein